MKFLESLGSYMHGKSHREGISLVALFFIRWGFQMVGL